MHFNADEIFIRQRFGDIRRGAAHAKTDLDNRRRYPQKLLRKMRP